MATRVIHVADKDKVPFFPASHTEAIVDFSDFKSKIQMHKITATNGDVLISLSSEADDLLASITTQGRGLHTFYASSSVQNRPGTMAVRGIAHFTSENYGWVQCQDSVGNTFTNYYYAGNWRGWKQLAASAAGTFSLELTFAEIVETQEQANLEMQLALAELADLILVGGDE